MSKTMPLGIPALCADITRMMFATLACLSTLVIQSQLPCYADELGTKLATLYEQQVDRRLNLPEEEQQRYAGMLRDALSEAGLDDLAPQYFVLVDRNVFVQAAMIFWKSDEGQLSFIGASPASTGKPGQFEHFETPIGVFEHTLDNLDFRAEGTRNEFGILGYGTKGMRIYDFGWLKAPKGWGDRHESIMRLQLHATDPNFLEPRLGSAQSKGCIRIPATLNTFIDHYGILDADYDRAIAEGRTLWVLESSREPTPWSGRYLVVVDTKRDQRPSWSPLPRIKGL
jgi:hypothetical protein